MSNHTIITSTYQISVGKEEVLSVPPGFFLVVMDEDETIYSNLDDPGIGVTPWPTHFGYFKIILAGKIGLPLNLVHLVADIAEGKYGKGDFDISSGDAVPISPYDY